VGVPTVAPAASAPAGAVAGAPVAEQTPPHAPRPVPPPRPAPAPSAPPTEALDLGATVLPVLARAYWKQGLGVLVVLALLWRLLRR
jgi:uncharacterized protein